MVLPLGLGEASTRGPLLGLFVPCFVPHPEQTSEGVAVHSSPPVVDCVVVGSGLAGLTAALTLFDLGASVIVLEKESFLGGNSVKVGWGVINVKMSPCLPHPAFGHARRCHGIEMVRVVVEARNGGRRPLESTGWTP